MSGYLPFDEPTAGDGAELRPGHRSRPLTVSELNEVADSVLGRGIGAVWIEGEVSRFLAHQSGHWYFTLGDGQSSVSCAMFRGRNAGVKFKPQDGLKVLVLATPGIYAVQGRYQLIAEALEPYGAGAAALALEQLKQRLAAEGLFDASRKRPLPLLPKRLGIATSPDGAAIRDVLRVLRRRFAGVEVLVAPCAVQGQQAGVEIVAALRALSARPLDVILLVRGGGAREDLAPFDDERVVRAIAASAVPVVTGIGHEIDTTLADLVADVRASTPSAAAEIVVRERGELLRRVRTQTNGLVQAMRQRLALLQTRVVTATSARGLQRVERRLAQARLGAADLWRRLDGALQRSLRAARGRWQALANRLTPESLRTRAAERRGRLGSLQARAAQGMQSALTERRHRLGEAVAGLSALSPLAVLARGYALATVGGPSGPIVLDAATLTPGTALHVRLARGACEATVRAVHRPEDQPS